MEMTELSESELNFLLSQISSVSGDVSLSDKTLEDLLRDCENDIPPLLLDPEETTQIVAKNVEYKKEANDHSPSAHIPSSNLFKNAIDSLSEITNLVKENLHLQDNDGYLWQPNPTPVRPSSDLPNGNSTYRANKTAIIRRDNALARVKSTVIETCRSENVPKTARSKSFESSRSDRNSVQSNFPSKPVKKATRQGTLSAAVKLYGKTAFVDKHAHVKAKVNSSLGVVRAARMKPTVKTNVCGGIVSAGKSGLVSSRVCNVAKRASSETGVRKGLPQRLVNSNQQSNSSVNVTFQVPKNSKSTSKLIAKNVGPTSAKEAWPELSPGSKAFRFADNERLTAVSQNLEAFELKLASIEDTYKKQLEELAQKCEALEMAEKARNANFSGATVGSKLLLDVCIQTEERAMDCIACQTEQDRDLSVELDNPVAASLKNDEMQDGQDDLTIDLNLPKKVDTAKVPPKNGKMTDRISSSTEKRQISIIRSLQLELDTVKKANLRLTTQLSSLNKMKIIERSRYGIKRSSSTQTEADRQDPTILREEAAVLRDRIKILEAEISALHEKRHLDLEILQNKHEEEVECLLQENRSLSKEIGAFQSWRSW